MSKNGKASLMLHLIKKDRNSPILSVQAFIYRILMQQQVIEMDKLWKKYKMNEANSLLIKRHRLTYQTFKELAEIVIATYQPYSLKLRPVECISKKSIEEDDLIPINV